MNATELFFHTIQTGNIANLKAQLERNPDLVNIKDARGFTPLIFATYFDKVDIAKILIDYNAPLDDQDASGNTALLGVCFKGNTNLANYLIEHGANINAKNKKGVTALIFSVMYNKTESIELLLHHNADKSLKDSEGKTAIDYAKEKGNEIIVNLLNG
jgi:ankyrin repeat protein